MDIYRADINYCNYLHYYEPKIPFTQNRKETRPFVGVVLCVNGKNFFAPLTSPKEKHIKMKNAQDFLKIDDGKLGGINFNNMIPIPKRYLSKIYIRKIRDENYKKMLYMQINWIEKNELRISNRAKNLYYLVTEKKANKELIDRCCDFRLLEQKCQEFMEKNGIKEEEILYSYL